MSLAIKNSMPDDLIFAIASGKPVSLEDITDLGIDINSSGVCNSRTALTAAAFAGNSSLITELVKSGADVHHCDQHGMAAIHEAASMGHEYATRTLLELGADIESATPNGHTALMMAAAWDNCEVVRFLLSQGANANRCDSRGGTALMIAEEKEYEQAAAILREHQELAERAVGADPRFEVSDNDSSR